MLINNHLNYSDSLSPLQHQLNLLLNEGTLSADQCDLIMQKANDSISALDKKNKTLTTELHKTNKKLEQFENSLQTATVENCGWQVLSDVQLESLRVIFEKSCDVIFAFDVIKNQLRDISPSCGQLFGYSSEEFLKNKDLWRRLFSQEESKMFLRQIVPLYSRKQTVTCSPLIHKNGTRKWIECRLIPVLDESGQLKYIHGVARDITEKITEEFKLRESEANLSAIIDNSSDIIWSVDHSGKLNTFNKQFQTLFKTLWGKPVTKGSGIFEFIKPLVSEELIQTYSAALQGKKSERIETIFINNTLRHFNISVSPLFFNGRQAGVVFFARDITDSLISDIKIRTSEANLYAIINNTNDAIFSIDKNYNILTINNACIQSTLLSTGKTRTIGSYFFIEEAGEEVNARWKIMLDKALEGESYKIELNFDLNNKNYTVEISFNPIKEDNKTIGVGCFIRDVTDKIESEQKLKISNERYELATKATNDAIWDWNFLTNEIYWSDGYKNLFGYQHTENSAHDWTKRIHPADVERVSKGISAQINSKSTGFWEDEYRYYRANGEIAYIYDRGFIVYDEHKSPVRMVGAMQDITKRKISEQLLQKSEANLQSMFNNTQQAHVLMDIEYKIISFNQCAFDGYKKECNLLLEEGRKITDLLPEDIKIAALEKYKVVLAGKKISYEKNFPQPDGSVSWYNIIATPVFDATQKVQGLILSISNITERKKTELEKERVTTQLLQRNQDLEQFAYIISHNLRAPVANITGLLNIVNIPDLTQEDFKRCLDGLISSVQKLDEVIIDLNFILQVRRGFSERKESVSFAKIVEDIKTSISDLLIREEVVIKTNFDHCDIFTTHKSYITSILYNLILNSVKYTRVNQQPIINISTSTVGNTLILQHSDNGLGINLQLYGDKIFGLYKKFHTHIDGKGMGLYMVKTQVEILGGSISVESELNKGTTFTISLPL